MDTLEESMVKIRFESDQVKWIILPILLMIVAYRVIGLDCWSRLTRVDKLK